MTRLDFGLWELKTFGTTKANILQTGLVEHDAVSLLALKGSCGLDEESMAGVELIERTIDKNKDPNMHRLHAETLAAAAAVIQMSGVESVIDFGCGEGLLLRTLAHQARIRKVIGVDQDEAKLVAANSTMSARPDSERRKVTLSSVYTPNILSHAEAVTVVEVIEHSEDTRWLHRIAEDGPHLIVVTTPNKDFNPLIPKARLTPNGLRNPDHKFEFTRAEFSDWAHAFVDDGYSVNLLPIGPADIEHGSSEQMAVLQKL